MRRALVIAAHGSQFNPNTALPAWACVDAIRPLGLFDEVTAAFWKEQPAFGTVLETLSATDVLVVPLFSSDGYFTRRVLPAELNPRWEQVVQITAAVGQNKFVEPLIDKRVNEALLLNGWAAEQTAVVIVGHGTERSQTSSTTTEYQAQRLRDGGRFGAGLTGYLDQEPLIGDVYQQTEFPQLLVVPNFIAAGLHTQEDIPAELGIEPLTDVIQQVHGRDLFYTKPLGTTGELVDIVLQLADVVRSGSATGSPWQAFPPLCGKLLERPQVGEVWLQHEGYLCHVADREKPVTSLQWLETPAEIRAAVRFDANGQYRPWATTRDLPRGWAIPAASSRIRAAVLQTIYPRLAVHGQPRSLDLVGGRQQGKYRPVVDLTAVQIDQLTDTVCKNCILNPSWQTNRDADLACIEPCMAWLDAAVTM
ncbi:MAG: hypothetical protein KDE51_14770 [Anaerolineales bacterium]|nr:hypothetical protein [Anaerolineales bacterium]